jgi:hypothetical protein
VTTACPSEPSRARVRCCPCARSVPDSRDRCRAEAEDAGAIVRRIDIEQAPDRVDVMGHRVQVAHSKKRAIRSEESGAQSLANSVDRLPLALDHAALQTNWNPIWRLMDRRNWTPLCGVQFSPGKLSHKARIDRRHEGRLPAQPVPIVSAGRSR